MAASARRSWQGPDPAFPRPQGRIDEPFLGLDDARGMADNGAIIGIV
jgi:hypothetical protein